MSSSLRQQVLRKIPSVDEILSRPEITDLLKIHPRNVVVEAVRKGLGRLRDEILHQEDLSRLGDSLFSFDHLYPLFQKEIHLGGQIYGVIGGKEESIAAVLDDFGDAPHGAGDHRDPGVQALPHHQRIIFGAGGDHGDVGSGQDAR